MDSSYDVDGFQRLDRANQSLTEDRKPLIISNEIFEISSGEESDTGDAQTTVKKESGDENRDEMSEEHEQFTTSSPVLESQTRNATDITLERNNQESLLHENETNDFLSNLYCTQELSHLHQLEQHPNIDAPKNMKNNDSTHAELSDNCMRAIYSLKLMENRLSNAGSPHLGISYTDSKLQNEIIDLAELEEKLEERLEKKMEEKLQNILKNNVIVPKEEYDEFLRRENNRKRKSSEYRTDEKQRKMYHKHRTSTVTSGSYDEQYGGKPLVDYPSVSSSDAEPLMKESEIKSHANQLRSDTQQIQQKAISSSKSTKKTTHHRSSSSTSQHRSSNNTRFNRTYSHSSSSDDNTNSVPKNTDKSFYPRENESKCCPICSKNMKRMTYHFKTYHPLDEVYISRFSPEMAERARHIKGRGVIHIKRRMQYIKALCLFCGVERDFVPHYWVDHLRSHTGEYANRCSLCHAAVGFYTHCSITAIRDPNEVNLTMKSLYGYLCKKCNFIQINEKNVRKHLKDHHDIKKDRSKYYRKITLMPSLRHFAYVRNEVPERSGSCTSTSSKASNRSHQMEQPEQLMNKITILEQQIIQPANNANVHNRSQDDHSDFENSYWSMPSHDSSAGSFNNTNIQEYYVLNQGTDNVASSAPPPPLELWKIDAAEEQSLLNIHSDYDRITDVFKINVRPWMEGDYAKKPILTLYTQFSQYKCMHMKCIFATDDEEQWKKHMMKHLDIIDVLTKHGMIKKDEGRMHIGFRECAYCYAEAQSNLGFCQHMDITHRTSAYQCIHCFYRTNEMDNIVLHYETFHNDKSPEEFGRVLLCNEQQEIEDKDYDLIANDCGKNVKTFICGQVGCTEDFACWNSFYLHICKHHGIGYKCPHCLQIVDTSKSDNIKNHLARHPQHYKLHEMDEFQCIYCNNTEQARFDHIDKIKKHMSQMHPSNFLFVGARESVEPENDNTKNDIQIVYAGDMYAKNYQNYKLFKCANPDVLNSMNPAELNAEKQLEELRYYMNDKRIETMEFIGPIPIKFSERENFSCVTYDKYKQFRNQYDRAQQNMTVSQPEETMQTIQTQSHNNRAVKQCPESIITYKSISEKMANDLESKRKSSYENQQCQLGPYLEHLMTFNDANPETILEKHRKDAIIYLQKEKYDSFVVYKLVRCEFECPYCDEYTVFATRVELLEHRTQHHKANYLHSRIVQEFIVIESNDPELPTETRITETDNFSFIQLFGCKHESNRPLGSKAEALLHHNQCHVNMKLRRELELTLNMFITKHEPFYMQDQYVFECMICSNVFDSIDNIHEHIDEIESQKNAGFTVHKLYRCTLCSVISTYNDLHKHYLSAHANSNFIAANILNSKLCGHCDYESADSIGFFNHVQKFHPECDSLKEADLQQLNVNENGIEDCLYAPECCPNHEFDNIETVINHVSKCIASKRLYCNDCFGERFKTLEDLVKHRQLSHKEDLNAIQDLVHNPKNFVLLFYKMQIIFNDAKGFRVTTERIQSTKLGNNIMTKIYEEARTIFESEQQGFCAVPIHSAHQR